MQLIKGDSFEFINDQKLTQRRFQWQEGYGAFTNSHSQIDGVVKYILNQKEHHKIKSFGEESEKILIENGVEQDDKYSFRELTED